MKESAGRHVYGLAAIGFGICSLIWHQASGLAGMPHRDVLSYPIALIEIPGGAAMLWPRTVRYGAVAVGTVYAVFAVVALTYIVRKPAIYNNWGNFFEQLSLATGAVILYSWFTAMTPERAARLAKIGYYVFAVCVVSFALEQWAYLAATASLVPKWIPPSPRFWAIATTVFFGLAAVALLTGLMAKLAARLTTAMLLGFAVLSWGPLLRASPHDFFNWSETSETIAIAGCAWIVATYVTRRNAVRAA
jgi:uncharacterized membrane protein YphA (DoxX/SURF4 family)